LLEESLTRQETNDDIQTKAFTRFYLAKAYHAFNAPDKALAQLRQVYPYLSESRQSSVFAALAAEAAWIMADNYLKQGQTDLARTALHDVLDLASDRMADIRQSAVSLLESLESEGYGSELDYDNIKRMRDKREMMRGEV
jgi:hypothetical protein